MTRAATALPRGSSPSALNSSMSIRQPIRREVRRAFWPLRPIAIARSSVATLRRMRWFLLVDDDLARHGRLQRLDDHLARIGKVLDDVDLLAAELADDRLHAGAAGADAGADRVDLGVRGRDGDLRAVARLAGKGLDLDGAVGDLGHLELEEPADELRAGAGQDDLRAPGGVLDLEKEAADAVARLVLLARDLLLGGHDRLGLAEVDVDVVALPAADGAGHDVADLVLEVVVDAVLLELAQALHHGLAGGLGGDAARGSRGRSPSPRTRR